MQIDYTCHNVHLDEPLRQMIEQKLQKVMKFVAEPVEIKVTLNHEKHTHIAELHITHKLGVVQAAEENDASLQEAIHLAVERAAKQVRRSRKKLVDNRRREIRGADRSDGHRWPVEILESESVGGGATPRVIEVTHLPIKPMTIDEAAMELDGSEHGFVVFLEAESLKVNVLFRRKDQHYGLVAPES